MMRRKCNKLSIKILLIYYLDSLVKVNAKIKIKILINKNNKIEEMILFSQESCGKFV